MRFASAGVLLRVRIWLGKRVRRLTKPNDTTGNIFDIRSTVHFMVEKMKKQP
jgi:hypothetical protein